MNNTSSWVRTFGVLIGSMLLCLPLDFARGEEKKAPEDQIGEYRNTGIDVVQQRVFRKGLRHELTLGAGVIPNNTFLAYYPLQFFYTYHFREGLAFEANFAQLFHSEKQILEDLAGADCPDDLFDAGGNPATDCGLTLQDQLDPTQRIYGGNIVWSPIYGKFSIFSKKIFHFDIFLTAGANYFENENSNRFAVNIGAGWKVFLNDWAALRLDFRNFTVREGSPFSHIVNNRMLLLGASFFLPSKPRS